MDGDTRGKDGVGGGGPELNEAGEPRKRDY